MDKRQRTSPSAAQSAAESAAPPAAEDGAAPPPGLEAVATAARGKPPRGLAQKRPDHLHLLHVFRALSPCFDGQHSLLEMMWRQDLSQVEVDAALRAFSDLVVTVQR